MLIETVWVKGYIIKNKFNIKKIQIQIFDIINLGYHILSFPNYSRYSVSSDGAIPVISGAISVIGHISNKLYDFYVISNLNNFAKWSRLVWLSQNVRQGTSIVCIV